MAWQTRYHPPELIHWQGRKDSPPRSSFFQIITLCNLQEELPHPHDTTAFGLIGFCCDEGVRRNAGRTGASEGPLAIRHTLAKLSVQKHDIICYDVGNINCSDGDLESSQAALADIVELLLKQNITPIVLGGGHELAFGHYQGIAHHLPHANLNIVNFDAHFDMRPLLSSHTGSSGTPFLQIAEMLTAMHKPFHYHCIGIQAASNIQQLFDTAHQYHVDFVLAEEIYLNQNKVLQYIDHIMQQSEIIYTSLCLDVFATPYAPGVSAPQALGLTPWQLLPVVKKLASSGKVISYDIAELSPKYDIDQRTAKLAAHFIQEIIHHHIPVVFHRENTDG